MPLFFLVSQHSNLAQFNFHKHNKSVVVLPVRAVTEGAEQPPQPLSRDNRQSKRDEKTRPFLLF